jgi:hypothetical protein
LVRWSQQDSIINVDNKNDIIPVKYAIVNK